MGCQLYRDLKEPKKKKLDFFIRKILRFMQIDFEANEPFVFQFERSHHIF